MSGQLQRSLVMTNDSRAKFYEIRDAFLSNIEEAEAAVKADRSLLEVRNGIGETVLHWLVVENVIPAVQSLISSGATVDSTNKFGATPLMEAASLGYEDMCRVLLSHGADVRYVSPRGESPLCHASRSRQLQTLRILLSQLEPAEDLSPYFDDIDLNMTLETDDDVSRLLRSRGLLPVPETSMNDTAESIALKEQLDYYRARASEYDQWWLRQGRYDRGPDLNSRWFQESESLRDALREFQPAGDILELACGTGLWTEQLLPYASSLTAVDGSSEMLSITQDRLRSSRVVYEQADVFHWRPSRQFDTIFFGFWLSHVPPARFAAFWESVAAGLAPGGRVFFVDSRHDQTSTATDHTLPPSGASTLRRRLNDGREYQIYKVFYHPSELASRLQRLGWTFDVSMTAHYFIHGHGHRRAVR